MAAMTEKVRYAQRVTYLGTVDKVLVALANEFSPYERLPSRAAIQEMIDKRARAKVIHYGQRRKAV